MKAARALRVLNVHPDHPARAPQMNNRGERYRSEGALSEVHVRVDLGLKNHELGIIAMSTDEAIEFMGEFAKALSLAVMVNNRERA